MKKLLFLMLPLSIIALASCGASIKSRKIIENDNVIIEKRLQYTNESKTYKYESDKKILNTYYFNGSKIPYVNIIDLVDAIDYYEKGFIEKEKNDFYLDDSNYSKHLKLDAENDIIYAYDFDFYNIDDMEYKYLDNYQKNLYMTTNELDEDKEVIIDLSKYDLEILEEENKLVLPFHVISSLFSQNSYYYVHYYGTRYKGYSLDDGIALVNEETDREPSYTKDYSAYQYNYLRFLFNELYGLSFYNKDNVDQLLENNKTDIIDKKTSVKGLNKLVSELSDLHTYTYGYNDFYSRDYSSFESEREKNALALRSKLNIQYASLYCDIKDGNSLVVEYNGTKALLISFNSFNINNSMNIIQSNIRYYAPSAGINNIIIDVSTNGGGDTFSLAEILGLMTNDDITLESYNIRSGHVSSETFKVDANYDGNFDDNDAYDYNYFVLSSGYSFSCANEFVNYCKKHNLAKIIGQKSGGGAFSISPAVTPFGSFFFYGSLNGFRDKNGNLTEDGIDVDYELSYDDFYSSQALITAIKSFE